MIKKNLPLVLGLAIPVVMTIFIAASIYLPSLFVHPRVSFLYSSSSDYYYGQIQYSVSGGKLDKNVIAPSTPEKYYPPNVEVKLFVYEAEIDKSREVTYDEAKALVLDSNVQSDDGFQVVSGGGGGGGGFPFFFGYDNDYNSVYLKGQGVTKKINIQLSGNNYYGNFRFLGWIK